MDITTIIEASEYIKSKITDIPETLVILGSGLGNLSDDIENKIEIPYSDIKLSLIHI